MGYWEQRQAEVRKLKRVAREAIKYQNREKLALVEKAVEAVRAAGTYDKESYRNSPVTKCLYDVFNITVNLITGAEWGVADVYYAGVMPPVFDHNNPIVDTGRRFMLSHTPQSFDTYAKQLKSDSIKGFVDLEKARLGGGLEKLESTMVISPALFKSESFTSLELAAIICHEVGHIFTYFEAMIYTTLTNMLARSTAEELLGTSEPKRKMEVLKTFSRVSGVDIKNVETAIDSKDKDVVYLHLYTTLMMDRANITGSEHIAERNWERASDEFVGRLGGSLPLSTGLYKIHAAYPAIFRESGMLSSSTHIAIEAAKLIFAIGTTVIAPPLLGISVVIAMHELTFVSTYDPIEERFKTMRNHLVGELRDLDQRKGADDKLFRERILDNIATVDAVLESVKDKPTLVQALGDFLIRSRRNEKAAIAYHKQLEEFMSNELIISANRLKVRM